jgi:uncharacterized protein
MSTDDSQTASSLPRSDEPTVDGFYPVGHLALSRRLGPALFRQRLHEQTQHAAGASHHEDFFRWVDQYVDFDRFVTRAVKLAGCYGWGFRNFKDIRIVEHSVHHPRLPPALDGFRLLQLSDVHLDLDPQILTVIRERLAGLDYDIAVITGDFRNTTDSDHEPSVRETLNLLACFSKPVFGVLGNHDFIEIVPPLEQAGLRFLLNEVVTVQHNGASFFLGGVDDPHFYKTHDLARVREAIPDEAFSILLCHSPETYRQVAAHGFDVMLSGHTHGGQICLPGGFALIKVCDVPRRLLRGGWTFRSLVGYTSVGTGSCGVPLRFFCAPEITLHTLRSPGAV